MNESPMILENPSLSTSPVEGKSKSQQKNDKKREEKLAKFQAKQAKFQELSSNNIGKAAKPKTLNVKTEDFFDRTIPGEKKDMSEPMADSYSPKAVEAAWYAWWEKCGFFKPEFASKDGENPETFTIIMPPPNVTGSLHLGHAMMAAIEDALVRWHRMNGKQVLYLPGCDHAGISTQAVVEKRLAKEKGLTKYDLGREAFVQEVWNWKVEYGDQIYSQLRRIGVSADWDRARFTLDPQVNEAVNEAFCRLFDDGLIFRANRLVHWSGKLRTALSDLEVDMMEIAPNTFLTAYGHDPKKKYEFGVMTSIAYKVEGTVEEIIIQTTRPETVFADTALAVNPNDERYKRFHGKFAVHPVMGNRIPIITDEAADVNLGTGALKVSPAHDPVDFALGLKHNLKFVSVFDENNILNENAGSFAGMKRFDARNAVIEHCRANGSFRGQTPHSMSLPICNRSGDIVEPRMIPQWWMNCKDVAKQATDAVRSGELKVLPKEHEKLWFYWLDNIRDWCLSRQLWWGHRIPAYKVIIEGDANVSGEEFWVAGRTYEQALEKAKNRFKDVPIENILLEQDPDVLDTWFSSALWPFSTMGWPDNTEDMEKFFPNSLLETGGDILFFWVARMVMLSLYLTGKVPFSEIFLHAMVRDAHGRKMSKSLGNVIDPIDVIEGITLEALQTRLESGNLDQSEVKKAKEGQKADFPNGIPQCGTDALRMALCSYVAQGRDVNLNILKVDSFRRFCNKIWNACRFALMKIGPDFIPESELKPSGNESLADAWILSKLQECISKTNQSFTEYNLMNAVSAVHSFWLYDLCDVYIEVIKPICSAENQDVEGRNRAQNILYTCLEQGLRLIHPFMPFISEELYQRLPRRPNDKTLSIIVSPFPKVDSSLVLAERAYDFERINNWAKEIRSFANEKKLPRQASIILNASSCESFERVLKQEAAICSLTRAIGSLSIKQEENLESSELSLKLSDDLTAIFILP